MTHVVARLWIKPEHVEQFLKEAGELVAATRKESGCISYTLVANAETVGSYCFVEQWENQKALDEHMASPHFTTIVPRIAAFESQDNELFTGTAVL